MNTTEAKIEKPDGGMVSISRPIAELLTDLLAYGIKDTQEPSTLKAAAVCRQYLRQALESQPPKKQPAAIATVQNVRNLISEQTGLKNDL